MWITARAKRTCCADGGSSEGAVDEEAILIEIVLVVVVRMRRRLRRSKLFELKSVTLQPFRAQAGDGGRPHDRHPASPSSHSLLVKHPQATASTMSDPSSAEAGPSSRPMTTTPPPPAYRPNPTFSFPSAFQPSIIRSFQKDAYYLSLLRSQLHDVSRTLLGSRFLQQHGQAVTLVAALGYHIFTTWDGAQTLGEEYVGSRMVASSSRQGQDAGSFVSKQRRVAFILVQVLAPFVLSRVYARIRRRLNASNAARQQALQRRVLRARAVGAASGEEPKPSRVDRIVAALCRWLPSLESLNRADGWIAFGTAVHLMLFYLGGRYYKVAQRLVGVEYVSRRRRAKSLADGLLTMFHVPRPARSQSTPPAQAKSLPPTKSSASSSGYS